MTVSNGPRNLWIPYLRFQDDRECKSLISNICGKAIGVQLAAKGIESDAGHCGCRRRCRRYRFNDFWRRRWRRLWSCGLEIKCKTSCKGRNEQEGTNEDRRSILVDTEDIPTFRAFCEVGGNLCFALWTGIIFHGWYNPLFSFEWFYSITAFHGGQWANYLYCISPIKW